MPVQRTFTVIPTVTSPAPAQHVRPMTTKQARKAYKASTKGPPMSRAERLKQERAEQERIRQEFEREKAAAKARLAREKKRDKELAEQQHKKRMRMPLVSVRPSQDTIARFVRGNGYGMKRDAGGEPIGGVPKEGEAAAREDIAKMDGDGTSSDSRSELDLIPEEDESDMEKLLDTISNGTGRGQAQGQVQVQVRPDADSAAEEDKISPGPSSQGQMRPPSRPCQPKPIPQLQSKPQQKPQLQPQPQQLQPQAQLQPSPSPPLILQPPPMSTQAILGNLDDFFPSSSQQALELQDETPDAAPSPPRQRTPPEKHMPPPPPPRRFFTPSGSNELLSLAIQRSKRTAALEELQDQAHRAKPAPNPPAAQLKPNSKPSVAPKAATEGKPHMLPEGTENKENARWSEIAAQTCAFAESDSQETEYGGDWVDELALDLIV